MRAKVNHRDLIYQGRVFTVYKDNVTLPNGKKANMDVVRHPGASAIVALTGENKIFLLKQYRYVIDDFIWEIPAGTLESGENPLDCAKRELIEETGFGATSWKGMGNMTPAPGYTDERIHLFLAQDLFPAEQNLDRDEILDVHQVPFDDALAMTRDGRIADSKSVTGILMAGEVVKGDGNDTLSLTAGLR